MMSYGKRVKPKSRMWEIHKSGSVRGIEVPSHIENVKLKFVKEPYYVYSTEHEGHEVR